MIRDKHVTNAAWMMYDGENKMGRYDALDAQTNPTFYLYDADGKRKMKSGTHSIHGLGGELLAEPSGLVMMDYIYRNGDLFFKMNNKSSSARWLVKDHLGTPRMVADISGNLSAVKRHDYLPFGEEIGPTSFGRSTAQGYGNPQSDGVRQQFTGYERDDESGLDFAQARMFGSSLGRFTSVDPLFIGIDRILDPQRLNLYVYVRNNPFKYVDIFGEDLILANANARQSVSRLFGGMTASERGRIVVAKGGQVTIKSCADCTGPSSSAFNVVSDAVSASYDIRLSLLKPGGTVTVGDGTKRTYRQAADGAGWAEEFSDGSWDILIPDGAITVKGIGGNDIPTTVATMTPHEIAHGVKQDAVTVENNVRRENNMTLRDPDAHRDKDHKTGQVTQGVTLRNIGDPGLIPVRPVVLPNVGITPRPMIPLPKKPEDK